MSERENPTILHAARQPESRDETCERCGCAVGLHVAYPYDIGGGVGYVCVPCGERMVAAGDAVLMMLPLYARAVRS